VQAAPIKQAVGAVRQAAGEAYTTNKLKSFFEIIVTQPNFGVGAKLTRSIWARHPDSYVTVQRVQPNKVCLCLLSFYHLSRFVLLQGFKYGKAWGVRTFKGKAWHTFFLQADPRLQFTGVTLPLKELTSLRKPDWALYAPAQPLAAQPKEAPPKAAV